MSDARHPAGTRTDRQVRVKKEFSSRKRSAGGGLSRGRLSEVSLCVLGVSAWTGSSTVCVWWRQQQQHLHRRFVPRAPERRRERFLSASLQTRTDLCSCACGALFIYSSQRLTLQRCKALSGAFAPPRCYVCVTETVVYFGNKVVCKVGSGAPYAASSVGFSLNPHQEHQLGAPLAASCRDRKDKYHAQHQQCRK